jgi:hypothetical protein
MQHGTYVQVIILSGKHPFSSVAPRVWAVGEVGYDKQPIG